MKILYISQYFPPEMGAPSARVSELSTRFVKLGHEVTVLTAFPNHPTGVVPPKYRNKIFQIENYNGVKVIRTYIYATPNKGIFKRSFSFISFFLSSIFIGIWFIGKQDILIATSPQFLCGLLGYLISVIKRVPYILEIRDLWPQSIVEVGIMKENNPIIKILEKLELFLYKRCHLLVGVTDSYKEVWIKKGIPKEKIGIIKNGVDLIKFKDGEKENHIRNKFNLNQHFVVSYIGTLGLAHGLETFINSAEILKNKTKIKFILVGEGAKKDELKKLAIEKKLDNIIFVDQIPREEIPDFIRASDVCVVLLKKSNLFEKVIPSKIFEIMGCSRPIILGVLGESKAIIEEANAGYSIEPENPQELSEKILSLMNDIEKCNIFGLNGRKYVELNFNRDKLANDYLELLKKFT